MRFYVLLLGQLLFIIISAGLTYLSFVIINSTPVALIGIMGVCLFLYLFIKVLDGYRRFDFNKEEITITKIFSAKETFRLNEIIDWKEDENIYRVKTRRLELQDRSKRSFINDWLELTKYEEVYHYFRTHLKEKNKLYS